MLEIRSYAFQLSARPTEVMKYSCEKGFFYSRGAIAAIRHRLSAAFCQL